MITSTAALQQTFSDFKDGDVYLLDEFFALMAHESTSATKYVNDLYTPAKTGGELDDLLPTEVVGVHEPGTWACLADLSQWGQFARGEYTTREVAFTVLRHEATTAPAAHFDY